MVFNSFGPRNDLFDKAMANAGPVRDWIMSKRSRAALAPGGFGMRVFKAVDSGELTEPEAGTLVRSYLSAGIDTTVYGLGNALYRFASYPQQWALLRKSPALIRSAFEEVLCFKAPEQTFFRTTMKALDPSGVQIGDGEKLLLFLAAARLESEAIFGALSKCVASFELTGEPEFRLNNTLRGLDTLPLRIMPV
jgi:4-methoxybenzoate monooxygenase (O-demethylating)